ncbi:LPXTG cell wall anchor domain-containing protein [Paramicrobacterium agarici]|uniref:LPXTG cell wall anchor domain-containing protein n=1 Tax=Paramicrobacterium agarici TaxID=630514 RepID=UPI0011512458|nr:LPXTG cell wall anchor domain-containing protein [Microbacterium agarici]TQO21730.1 LPXTG-motif cell wall-anchored protein [Microbacterium agarici]
MSSVASRRTTVTLRTLGLGLAAGALIAGPLLVDVRPASAAERTAWEASGPDNTYTLDFDGTTAPAQFSYDMEPAGLEQLRTWSMMTTADQDGTVTVEYEWTGNHAWCDATTILDQVIEADGSRNVTSVIDEGPNCSGNPPNGDFAYTGTVSFDVSAGDRYGFDVRGSNRDLNNFLRGTLRLGIPELPESQTITFPALADTMVDDGPVALAATASSDLPVSYASTTRDVCTIDGSSVVLNTAGTCTIEASEWSAPFEFDRAAQTQSFVVLPRTSQISVQATEDLTVGEAATATATVTPAAATGNVLFAVYGDDQCLTEALYTATSPLSAEGTAESGEFVPDAAGTYYWVALYLGDDATVASTTECGDVQTVAAVAPTEPPVTPTPTESATPPPAPADDASAELPRTGADGAGSLAALGAALLAAGLVLITGRTVARRIARNR